MGYYPLHFLVSTLGAPMFIATDRLMNNSWRTTGMHAFLNYSLLQAWFPSEAEIWNPPTWFLSALSFANITLPSILPQVAKLSKDGLQKLLVALSAVSLLQKLSYSQAWKFYCCGGFAEKTAHPYLWNVTRFHPFGALVEIVIGVAAARCVMLDDESQKPSMNPLWLFLASYASLGLRLTTLNLNDAMIRTLLFMPLYTKFLVEMHRDCLTENPHRITRFFGSKSMTWLGSLAFPMFILHGPLGQIFYKKKIAEKLWGGILPKRFFPLYLLLVMVAGHFTNEYFVKSKRVQQFSTSLARKLADSTKGMLSDSVPLKRKPSSELLAGA
ncbi:Cytochrome P450 CYP72A219 [Durusdinium trenchii]